MTVWLRKLWEAVPGLIFCGCYIGCIYGMYWFAIDHRTPAQREAEAAKAAAELAELDRQEIELIEKACGEISAKTFACVKGVMEPASDRSE
jgi:hypothetical protein